MALQVAQDVSAKGCGGGCQARLAAGPHGVASGLTFVAHAGGLFMPLGNGALHACSVRCVARAPVGMVAILALIGPGPRDAGLCAGLAGFA